MLTANTDFSFGVFFSLQCLSNDKRFEGHRIEMDHLAKKNKKVNIYK